MKETEKLVFQINDLLTIQIRNRKLKRYVSKELLIWKSLRLLILTSSKKFAFRRNLVS